MSDFQDKITGSPPRPGRADAAGEPRDEATQRVEYTLTVEDVAAFMRYHAKQPRVGLPGWPVPLLLGVALALLLLRRMLLRPGPAALSLVEGVLIGFVPGYLLLYFFGKPLRRYLLLRALRHNPRFPESRTLAITE